MFRKYPDAPCVVTKVRLVCGAPTTLTIALGITRSDDEAKAIATRQVAAHLPGATVKSMRVHR
jgi:3-methyladenine DNA glycosylase Mpg